MERTQVAARGRCSCCEPGAAESSEESTTSVSPVAVTVPEDGCGSACVAAGACVCELGADRQNAFDGVRGR